MKQYQRIVFFTVTVIFILSPLHADDEFNRRVEKAIDRGTEFLLEALQGKAKGPDGKPVGTWTAYPGYPMGCAAIQVYALVKSDIPYTYPVVKEGLDLLNTMPMQKTYSVALYVMALDAVLKQMEVDAALGGSFKTKKQRQLKQRMETATSWLVNARLKGQGAWNYGMERNPSGRYDHSNTQFAILGLGVAYKRGMNIPQEVWEEIADHFIKTQAPNGPLVTPRWELKKPAEDTDSRKSRKRTKVAKRQEKPKHSRVAT